MTVASVLLVPGAWHKPAHWDPLIRELADIDVHTVALTSTGDDPAELTDMYADAQTIDEKVRMIGGPVVVVAHSYGGMPTTQALANAENVRRIIYVAAFQLDVGDTALAPNGGALMPWARLRQREWMPDYVEAQTPMTVFYNDLEIAAAQDAISRLGYQSYAAMRQPLTATAWTTIPSTYVVCEHDNAIPVAAQERMAERAHEVHRLNASHAPFPSQPATLARLIRDAVRKA